MKLSESIAQFYQHQGSPETTTAGQFNVYDISQFCASDLTYNRRDFYKIALLTGVGQFHYADRSLLVDRPALVFSNPRVPYSYKSISDAQSGYFCVFTEDFLITQERNVSLQESPLFRIGSNPVFFVDDSQLAVLSHLFQQLLAERDSPYLYRQDLLRTYVTLIIHQALKMQPPATYEQPVNAASRIVNLFTELLERQFPIASPRQPLQLRTAGDFATCLSVHVNHLNRAVRELTGKTTTTHIAGRMTSEAKALLQHTDWPVADIAYALGFAYPTYFNNFFKQQTGLTPGALRGKSSGVDSIV